MNKRDQNVMKALADSREFALQSKENAILTLQRAGILNKKGELEKIYEGIDELLIKNKK